jgi:hypothetical protein
MEQISDGIEEGWSAHGRDGVKIGQIEEVGVTHLLVSRSLSPSELYVPLDAVADVDRDAGHVTLEVESSTVDDLGWSQRPMPTPLAADPGVDGLGYTGREPGENAPVLAEDGVEGLGFTGRGLGGDADDEDAPRL